ncbi:MAG TPA: SCO1664 family protein [Candidatus Nanopelagicus sp.]|nr:SCO1664 family protein [Candidatus Nanopelagicus sp.]
MNISSETLSIGDIKVIGRLIDASNATLMGEIVSPNSSIKVIYKPIAGEKPLWDFQDGNLAFREYCAFLVSDLAGFNIVPATILRDGPFGLGMVQQWIEIDRTVDVVEFGQSEDRQLRKLALFDSIINNTDRKYGHLLIDSDKKLFGCDHGVSFHSQNKLRTVIWQFAGEKFTTEEMALLERTREVDFNGVFENYLTDIEISAFSDRINTLIASGTFPLPSDEWPAIPWPPV